MIYVAYICLLFLYEVHFNMSDYLRLSQFYCEGVARSDSDNEFVHSYFTSYINVESEMVGPQVTLEATYTTHELTVCI